MVRRIPFRFDKRYFVIAASLFVIEVLIALFMRDQFIRPYFGDVLVVILMYCFIMSFLKLPVIPVVACVVLFAFLIEFLQYLQFVNVLGLQDSVIASTVMGTSFAWNDMLAYVAGGAIVLMVEMGLNKKTNSKQR